MSQMVRVGSAWKTVPYDEVDEGIIFDHTFRDGGKKLISSPGSGYHEIPWASYVNPAGYVDPLHPTVSQEMVTEDDCFYRVHFITAGQLGTDTGANFWYNQQNLVYYSGASHFAPRHWGDAAAWSPEFPGASWGQLAWDQTYDIGYGVIPAATRVSFGAHFKFAANDRYIETNPFSFQVTVQRWRRMPAIWVRESGAWKRAVSVQAMAGGIWHRTIL